MRTWEYNLKTKKVGPAYIRWKIERLMKYGFGEERVPERLLKHYLPELNLPEDIRTFWELVLWNKRP